MPMLADALAAPALRETLSEIETTAFFTEPVPVFLTIMSVILLAPLISEWLRLPAIVGLILSGIVIGPHGLDILAVEETVELLSTVGLIYLMFTAGLEIDLHEFGKVRNKAILFGMLTFSIPLASGVIFAPLFELDFEAGLLLGSVYATQTLVAFPIVTRLGIARNQAVAVTIGATIFTDVASLLMLAAIAGGHHGDGDTSPTAVAQLLVSITVYSGIILWGLPRVGRFFFKRFTGHNVEFQFVLVSLFVAAYMAEFIGMEAIVGAFLAGLAINATLPHRSPVLGRVIFVGEAFFIPIFLMYIGMIADPAAFLTDAQTLFFGVMLTVIVYLTKGAAAAITTRMMNYSREQGLVIWGLSHAHAAVALAVIQIGVDVGLFSEQIFNGAILMVLATCISSPLIVQRWGKYLQNQLLTEAPTKADHLFERILVPIANPATEESLIGLAGILTRTVEGTLMPINVIRDVDGRLQGVSNQKQLMDAPILHDHDTHIQPLRRVDSSISKGILHAAIENEASLIVMGWRGKQGVERHLFGGMLDEVVAEAAIPVMVCRMGTSINTKRRVVLAIQPHVITLIGLEQVLQTARVVGRALNVPLVILSNEHYGDAIYQVIKNMNVSIPYTLATYDDDRIVSEVKQRVTDEDLVIITTIGTPHQLFESSLGKVPEDLAREITASLVVLHYPEI